MFVFAICFSLLFSGYALVLPELPVDIAGIIEADNGTSIDIIEAPYNVALLTVVDTTIRHHCGASIIREDTVVTSGFCLYYNLSPSENPHHSMIKAGTTYYGFGGQQIWVDEMILHPDFNHESYENNIGIITLQQNILFSSTAAPVTLPVDLPDFTKIVSGVLTGWSKTVSGGKTENLMKFVIPLSDQVQCGILYPDDVFCASSAAGSSERCYGDVGNPLVTNGVLIGITLWSFDCGSSNSPWIFTNVAPFVDWLNPVITTSLPETTTGEIFTTATSY